MIKGLVRKYLLEYSLLEADPMGHFKDRVKEVIGDIQSIKLPPQVYLPNIPKDSQDAWIISQIKSKLLSKIDAVSAKDYPKSTGSCVLVPLGIVKLQPVKGNPANILITAKRREGLMTGYSYYITVYENRMPTIVLADPKNPNNSSIGNQFNAHLKNTLDNGWIVKRENSYIDKSFINNIVIQMSEFNL